MPRLKAMLKQERAARNAANPAKADGKKRRALGKLQELEERQVKFRTLLGELIRADKITRQEAGELWTLAFGERRGAKQGERRRRGEDDEFDLDRNLRIAELQEDIAQMETTLEVLGAKKSSWQVKEKSLAQKAKQFSQEALKFLKGDSSGDK